MIASSGIRTIVLVARWAHYSSEPTYGREARTRVVISDADDPSSSVTGNSRVLAGGLRRTLESLRGYAVFVVDAVPEVGYEVPEVLARIRHLGTGFDIRPGRADFEERQRPVQFFIDSEQRHFGFAQLSPARRLCDWQRCEVILDGPPLYFDSHHLSNHGVRVVADEFEPVFAKLATPVPTTPVSGPQ